MTEILSGLVRANLAAGAAILVVMALRLPVRRHFGAQSAYALWLAAPLVFLAVLLPAPEADSAAQAARAAAQVRALIPAPLHALQARLPDLAGFWIGGLVLALGLVAASQIRFLNRARAGLAGPALVGVICPRIVTPRSYEASFSEAERAVVRAHERAHIERGDPKVNAFIALAQCLCWFNPLVHLAAHLARLDQELACDATVIARQPGLRRLYAETMLKTQLTAEALPLGCHWVSGRHPLEVRIGMLRQSPDHYWRHRFAAWGACLLALGIAYGAWAAKPPVKPHRTFAEIRDLRDLPCPNDHAIVMIHLSRSQLDALPQPRI